MEAAPIVVDDMSVDLVRDDEEVVLASDLGDLFTGGAFTVSPGSTLGGAPIETEVAVARTVESSSEPEDELYIFTLSEPIVGRLVVDDRVSLESAPEN